MDDVKKLKGIARERALYVTMQRSCTPSVVAGPLFEYAFRKRHPSPSFALCLHASFLLPYQLAPLHEPDWVTVTSPTFELALSVSSFLLPSRHESRPAVVPIYRVAEEACESHWGRC